MMNRSFRIALPFLALFASSAPAQDTAQKVTFSSPAASAKNLLAELAKLTKVTFSTSPQTANEVLVVDVKDVALNDLMKRIATAAAAEWQTEGDGFRLVRSQSMQNQQEREYLEDRSSKIRAEQAILQKELDGQPKLNPAEIQKLVDDQHRQSEEIADAIRNGKPVPNIQKNSGYNMTPANRLAIRLLLSMNAFELAKLAPSSRTVYSSFPTQMQYALPSGATGAIVQFTKEYDAWLAAQPPRQTESPAEGKLIIDPWSTLQPMNGGLGKVLLVVSRNMFVPDLQVELVVADRSGQIVARQFRNIRTSDQPLGGPPRTADASNSPAVNSSEKGIDISTQAREHAALLNQAPQRNGMTFFASPAAASGRGAGATNIVRSNIEVSVASAAASGGGGRPPRIPVSSDWQEKLAHPERNDPLSFAVSDLYTGLAHVKGENLVASLPDSVLVPLSTRSLQMITPTALIDLSKTAGLKVEEKDGWLTVSPKFPAYARATRVNREELSKLLVAIQKEGRMSLDSLCRYALSRNDPAPNPALDSRYLSVLFPAAFADFSQAIPNWRIHQLYATLSAEQRQSLGKGGAINLGLLAPQQQNIVRSMVFDDQMGPSLMQPEPNGAPNVSRQQFAFAGEGGNVMRFGNTGGKLSEERTEFLPTGIPGAGTLTVEAMTTDAVYASRKDGTADPRFMNAETLGMYMGMGQNMILAGGPQPSVPQYDTFRLAQTQTMSFIFRLSPQAEMAKQLRDSWFVNGANDVGYDGLPQDFRTRAEDSAKRMGANGPVKIGFGGERGVKPPL